ncbi:shikimate dehydrogenase [Fusobacterium perfoetens]|uniref:shikimate dehydrogenase n=1 Tax=Fusobacterium perfoetens TaxID=852 RepID=UPI0004858B23|nr:shikimate dehydrogenase [Fusobacterium perfoetens]
MKKKLGLIGEKLPHSLSPKLHKEIFKNLDIQGDYSLIELKENQLEKFLTKDIYSYLGVNITIPYKIKSMDFVEVSKEAQEIGAINTILVKDGKLFGYNTDYFGFKRMLEENNIFVDGKDTFILGAGGGARAVIKYFLDRDVKSITIVVRNIQKAKIQLDSLIKNKENIEIIDFKTLEYGNYNGYIVVNCTPVGMYPNVENSPITKEVSKNFENSVDLIYNPLETKFLKFARENNKNSLNGMYMLIAQGVASEEIWNNINISKEVIEKIIKSFE